LRLGQLINQLPKILNGEFRLQEPMKFHTSWKIGGPVDVMVFPRDESDICRVIKACGESQVPWWVIGCGSNILVLDGGIRGVVIKTENFLHEIYWTRQGVVAEAGAFLPKLAKEAVRKGWAGLEWSVGIPASVGGAVVMNAGIGSCAIGDFVSQVEVVDETGVLRILQPEELSFRYRYSILQERTWIVSKVFINLKPGNKEILENKIREQIRKRKASQPLELPSAGSVFKNPSGDYAGRLIEAVGAKGFRCGGAEVSGKHANFIVNLGGATARDVLTVIDEVRRRVRESFNIELETEVRVVGEAR